MALYFICKFVYNYHSCVAQLKKALSLRVLLRSNLSFSLKDCHASEAPDGSQ